MGYKLDDVYESGGQYMKAASLKNDDGTYRKIKRKVAQVTVAELSKSKEDQTKEKKMVLHFAGHEEGMVLNWTNANMLALEYGDDSDRWIGKTIGIKVGQTNFGPGLQLVILEEKFEDEPAPQSVEQAVQKADPPTPRPVDDFDADDIPF